jgi:hypothetical protein
MFLPCDNNDLGVLDVKYAWGKPLQKLNDLLAPRAEAAAPGIPPPAPALTYETALVSGFADARARAAAVPASARSNLMEALDEVRRAMETHYFYRELPVPQKYASAVEAIQNPLQPRLDAAPRDRTFALTLWWTQMHPFDRAEFAAFYGVWCARFRAYGK